MATDDHAFFNKERDRLTAEITSVWTRLSCWQEEPALICYFGQGFEELLSSSNTLNRKLEEVLGMTREYETIAALWQSFHELMRGQKDEETQEEQIQGLPGTGGHVIAATQQS